MAALLILAGFIAGVVLVEAQDHAVPDLTVREIVEVLAEFDVKHADQQPFFKPAYGVTDFSSTPPTIWLFNVGDTTLRRMTVIHELIHVRCRKAVVDCPEEYVGAEEMRQYQKLFGVAQ